MTAPLIHANEGEVERLREALTRYMAAVKALGTRSKVESSRNLFDERPISEAGLAAWYELNEAGKHAAAALSTPAQSGEGRTSLSSRLSALIAAARGCEFDLVPADGPIARLTLFMHEHGERIVAAISAPAHPSGGERGGFSCPICGQDTPHHHTPAVVDANQNKRRRS